MPQLVNFMWKSFLISKYFQTAPEMPFHELKLEQRVQVTGRNLETVRSAEFVFLAVQLGNDSVQT